ncbi:MAG: UDP-N-acetylmuramoyl-L-alanine--D-glutamate ligase [Chloroflexaceae bacterium]|nr:UDP-N-acetylmuramoyl-L-alanine--D-glutamate ligase [Chloroflexaceae bacterium]
MSMSMGYQCRMNDPRPTALAALANQRIMIAGLGREGLSTCAFLRRHLPDVPLVLADQAPLEKLPPQVREQCQQDTNLTLVTLERETGPDLEHLAAFDIIFRSPGIPPDLPLFQAARARGATITSNMRLFFDLCPGIVVGVTGTKGKSTTASLIAAILKQGDRPVQLIGNIGVPALSVLDQASPETVFVAELSSYQLADLERSPHLAVVLGVVPEHLSYHRTFDAYAAAKATITRHQTKRDYVIFNRENATAAHIAHQSRGQKIAFGLHPADTPGYGVWGDQIVYGSAGAPEPLLPVQIVPLMGRFNLQNVMPALAVGRLLGIPIAAITEAIRTFQPLEHRMQYAGRVGQVCFYDDSLSTVPEATVAAMEALAPAPLILLAGGYDRGLDYRGLAQKILEANVRALLLFPPTGERLWDEVVRLSSGHLPLCLRVERMPEAVQRAWEVAVPGDVVLLSPASASFSQFIDYRDRGNQFQAEVAKLAEQTGVTRSSTSPAPPQPPARPPDQPGTG